ncbi:unnamed protein product [marine sediment metagenome]|uniref:Uncharacterized protein n=1 Tax=marine sediment metagenome TaxID=412755 RepID=X1M2I0_9ZZZZ
MQCFGCGKFAKSEDCDLRRHRVSGVRRWFHKEEVKASCLSEHHKEEDWELVDPSLGETTYEEAMSIIHTVFHLKDNKN